jgi:hypothetical protein
MAPAVFILPPLFDRINKMNGILASPQLPTVNRILQILSSCRKQLYGNLHLLRPV